MNDMAPAPAAEPAPAPAADPAAAPAAAAPAADPAAAPAADPAAPAPPEWMAGLSEEHRAALAPKGYKSPDDLAKAYIEAQRFIHADGTKILVPGEDAEPEAWDKFYSDLGRPETPDKYEFYTPEGMEIPEDLQMFREAMAGSAFKNGLTSAQFSGVEEVYNEVVTKIQEAKVAAGERQLADLKIQMGDKWAAHEAMASNAFKALVPDGAEDELEEILGSARLVNMFANAGARLQGRVGTVDGGQDINFMGDPMKDPASAAIEIDKIMKAAEKDREHPYVNSRHPDHKKTTEQVQRLYTVAYPDS